MYVYKILNEITGDFYIGKTARTLQQRFKQHQYDAKRGSETIIHRAMRKYGFENFSIQVLEQVEDDLDSKECLWIERLDPLYNMTSGGEGGDTSKSPKYKEYMKMRSELISGENNPFYGKRHTEETKRMISEKKKGTKVSEETKEKLRAANTGKKMSPESIAKSAAAKAKTYYLTDPEGNSIVVNNLSEFCRENGLDQGNMNAMYKGKYKSCKGYTRT